MMKIQVIEVCVEDIPFGKCFKWDNEYWIKSNGSVENNAYYNCVELEAGNQRWFKKGDKVERVEGQFQIHA